MLIIRNSTGTIKTYFVLFIGTFKYDSWMTILSEESWRKVRYFMSDCGLTLWFLRENMFVKYTPINLMLISRTNDNNAYVNNDLWSLCILYKNYITINFHIPRFSLAYRRHDTVVLLSTELRYSVWSQTMGFQVLAPCFLKALPLVNKEAISASVSSPAIWINKGT